MGIVRHSLFHRVKAVFGFAFLLTAIWGWALGQLHGQSLLRIGTVFYSLLLLKSDRYPNCGKKRRALRWAHELGPNAHIEHCKGATCCRIPSSIPVGFESPL